MDGNTFSDWKGRYVSPSNIGIPVDEGLIIIIFALFLLASPTSSEAEEIFSCVPMIIRQLQVLNFSLESSQSVRFRFSPIAITEGLRSPLHISQTISEFSHIDN